MLKYFDAEDLTSSDKDTSFCNFINFVNFAF